MPDSSPTRGADPEDPEDTKVRNHTSHVLLIPQPLLSLAYLAGVRAHMVEPSFLPILILALFPLSAVAGGVLGLRGQDPSRGHHWTVVAIGLIELGWTAVALAIVGFAIALRSG